MKISLIYIGYHLTVIKMLRIENEAALIERLYLDIQETDKKNILVLAGHFPLVYTREEAVEAFDYWGEFPTYTLELGCITISMARKSGKTSKLLILTDDHSYEEMSGIRSSRERGKRRDKLYKARSNDSALLLPAFYEIMQKHGLGEQDVLRQDHGKPGREDCLYFSEKLLRATGRNIINPCARAYTNILENKRYFNKESDYMVAFIPFRCRDNICDITLDEEIELLSASHIFLSTNPVFTRDQLFSEMPGVLYRKD